ncbi:phenylethanolamine N-methyltransferase isoform X1 [Emydura macquarii macquarii]|uniref:phenylethanolamine N-methyltransferase isoform X1 n=1 Tax=Emydura macquarii macquarii TaxID=1129001 RepID=UPI00352B2D95
MYTGPAGLAGSGLARLGNWPELSGQRDSLARLSCIAPSGVCCTRRAVLGNLPRGDQAWDWLKTLLPAPPSQPHSLRSLRPKRSPGPCPSAHAPWPALPLPAGDIHGRTLLDVGTGPTVYQLLSACDHFEEIIATDYLEVNRDVLRRWVQGEPDAFDWSPYIKHVCSIEGKGEQWKEKEQKLRGKLRQILPIDVHQPEPLGSPLGHLADALISTFCLEAVSPDRPSFERALRNVTSLLKPGGHFLLIGALEESFYLAGEAKLSVVPVREADVKEALAKSGYQIHDFRSYVMPPSLKIGVDDVSGVFFAHAQRTPVA